MQRPQARGIRREWCAILHKKHYDLGVLHTAEGIQAVFQVDEEWDNAIRLILRFIKAKLLPLGSLNVSSGDSKVMGVS